MIPKEINDTAFLSPDLLAFYVNKNSYGFDFNPDGRSTVRIAVRVGKLSKGPVKAIAQAFSRESVNGIEGKKVTLTNLAPGKVTLSAINNKTGEFFPGLTHLVILIPNDRTDDIKILEKG